jgi:hypothetical protein
VEFATAIFPISAPFMEFAKFNVDSQTNAKVRRFFKLPT